MSLRPQPIITTRPGTSLHGTSGQSPTNTLAPVIGKGTLAGSTIQPFNPTAGLPVIGRQNPTVPYVGNTPTNGGIVSAPPNPSTIYRSLVGGLFS